ncbi:MAG: DNA methyltransferase [Candidatus Methylomirabilota bacterium]
MAKRSALVDTRVIYCGDNLDQLRKLPDGCVDLVYIDPPFNSNRNYEVFWGETKERRSFEDRHESTQAYIEFMRPRCVEMARVLKKTGSFYYHCDWHADSYVRVMLDQIFGESSFRSAIVWKRADAHNDAVKQFAAVYDTIFFYTKSDEYAFNIQHSSFPEQTLKDWYLYLELPDGTTRRMTKEERETQVIPPGSRRFNTDNLRSPNPRPNLTYEYKGYRPHKNGWAVSQEKMAELDAKGLLIFPKNHDGRIMRKKYLDERPGPILGNLWADISQLRGADAERLGYPTQKPIALLERIINASSNKGDIVLDAFCGCGTALVAAENLGRQWIGIDISPTACRVMAKRLQDVCGVKENEELWKAGRGFVVRDLPWTEKKLREIPPFEFENWAIIALGGHPNKAKVGDMGIDGRIYPVEAIPRKAGEDELAFMDAWWPVQVKQKDKVGRPEIDSFEAVLIREKRTKGYFVAFGYSEDAMREIDAFFRREHKSIVAFTVQEILEGEIARKLA